jgi:hypothetical protein
MPSYRTLRRIIYAAILIGLIGFLWRQGAAPWSQLAYHWQALMTATALTLLSYLGQSITFRECLPKNAPRPSVIFALRVWAIGSITSLLAPLAAGLAVRTVLFHKAGFELRSIGVASLRQTWLNLEYSALILGFIFTVFPWGDIPLLGGALLLSGFAAKLARRIMGSKIWPAFPPYISWLFDWTDPPSLRSLPWFCGQILLIGTTYFSAFNLTDAPLSFQEALLLAGAAILITLVNLVPNGLGILDGLWVWLAQLQGLELSGATGLALLLRVANLTAALILWAIVSLLLWRIEGRKTSQAI